VKQVTVELGSRSYAIHIGSGLHDRVAAYLAEAGLAGRLALVTDSNVLALYGTGVQKTLTEAGNKVILCEIAPGERSKTLEVARELYERFLLEQLDRTSAVVALGGGVVGDLAGFVAATYMRGIPYAQVPTTVVAQVDSSVGGKVGVNLPEAKNVVGSFYQPRIVISDVSTLRTLPEREFRAGLAEVVKCGVIADADLFRTLEARREAILARDRDILEELIERCCRIKARIVHEDETERGMRVVLNYGHTIGHAIEASSGYGRFLHGEAIAIGMDGAARIGAVLGVTDEEFVARQAALIDAYGLPRRWSEMRVAEVMAALAMDKKRASGVMRFILASEPGCASVRDGVDERVVVRVLEELKKGAR
jgi:3-dehydroquinate synthase